MSRITIEEFEQRVLKQYDGRITVVRDTYTGTRNKVTAYCNVHKIYFEVRANRLQRGETDCPECYKDKLRRPKNSWESILERFIKKYGNKFSYDKETYNGYKNEMIVHCNDCGEMFSITPEHHLKYNNGGCPNCHIKKIIICSKCGKEIFVDRRVSAKLYICKDCHPKHTSHIKNEVIINTKKYYCKICGRILDENHKCKNQFCNEHNQQQFKSLIKYFGFDKTKLGTIEIEDEFYRIRSILYNMYWNESMSSSEICDIFNYPDRANLTRKVFKYLNIKSKTVSWSQQENLKMGRHSLPQNETNYCEGYHKTWDNKEVYLRSSYEFDYAKDLDELHILYEVENFRISYFDTQKNKERIALPDFYLPETNTIVEVKSSWTLDKQNMIDKRKAYLELGYNFKLLYEHQFVELDDIEETKKRA